MGLHTSSTRQRRAKILTMSSGPLPRSALAIVVGSITYAGNVGFLVTGQQLGLGVKFVLVSLLSATMIGAGYPI